MSARALDDPDAPPPTRRPRELALSAAWHGGMTRSLHTVDGRQVNVVFPGHWSHGHGPDFTGAMLELPGRGLVTGAVELHHNASDWTHHGHHLDPRYNEVVLHVVSRLDTSETRCADGRLVPMAVLTVPDEVLFRIDARLPGIWEDLGGEVCAADLAQRDPQRLVRALQRLGDRRLAERVTCFEGELAIQPPRDLLTTALLDALGYSENRQPMRDLAALLNAANWSARLAAQPPSRRPRLARALTLGLAGFLPLSPNDAHLARLSPAAVEEIERCWREETGPDTGLAPLTPTAWVRARTRPANHPAARLAIAARLLACLAEDPVGELIAAFTAGVAPVTWLRQCAGEGEPALGASRATAIAATVLIPLAIAIARREDHQPLEDAAALRWEDLGAAEWSRPARRAMTQVAGDTRLRGLGERGNQGLLYLDRACCQPRRCFECPIAAEVVRDRLTTGPDDT